MLRTIRTILSIVNLIQRIKRNKQRSNKKLPQKTEKQLSKGVELICPTCNINLVARNGKNGKFYGCSNFPSCRYTQNI